MCGISGMVSFSGAPLRHAERLREMARLLRHRGPDNSGTFCAPHARPRAAIAVNRLRIRDLSSIADQPFTDERTCVTLGMNGEIYNSAFLRRRYRGHPFRSTADTEVILPLYEAAGPSGLRDVEGMFAVAIWDEPARRLVLARDRAGEKPLFYAVTRGEVWFASEAQALLENPEVDRSIDQAALDDYLCFGYVREPRTMWTGIRKVPAGTALVFESPEAETVSIVPAAAAGPGDHSPDALARVIGDAVRRQLVADVPVGVFLSGGVDSSLVAAIAAREFQPGILTTFAVRFPERSYDEGGPARAVAAHIGASHHEVMADLVELRRAYSHIASLVAEPIADPAILPMWLLASKAREEVGVVLTGEGADELFGGYPTYLGHRLTWAAPLARLAASMMPRRPDAVPLQFLLERFESSARLPWRERHIAWFGTGLALRPILASGERPRLAGVVSGPEADDRTDFERAMAFDYETKLRDGLLPKVDRATMLVSLEARAPYLDRSVIEFAAALPANLMVRGLSTKWLLKQAATGLVPPEIVRRRKHGLSVPIAQMMNEAVAGETFAFLEPGRIARQGLLNARAVGQLLSEYRGGNVGLAREVWTLLVLQDWIERWGG